MSINMDPFGSHDLSIKLGNKTFKVDNESSVLASNLIFTRKDADWYNKCNRYGWIDPLDNDRVTKEYLFFTKPDLDIFDKNSKKLLSSIKNNPVINEVANRLPKALSQLQKSVNIASDTYNPFMYIFSNAVASKLDLPGISSDSQESTSNIMGTSIQYRGHSLKSDNGYDFSLSFKDTAYLEIYSISKCYDEYMRMLKLGEIEHSSYYKDTYIVNHIVPEYFSIYKFLVGSDGETILYYAKLTGCYFTDVPRSDFGDPSDEGFKYSLSFHAQFVEDMNPQILSEFQRITPKSGKVLSVYNSSINAVNNLWAKWPKIVKASKDNETYGKRVTRRGVKYDYFLKWLQ